jgi:hypothetical protein
LEKVTEALSEITKKFYDLKLQEVAIPRANFSSDIDEWKNMSSLAEDIIRSHYAEDFRMFGYPDRIDR